MLGAILALAVVAGSAPSPDPAALVAQLGSPRYRQRESAEAALARLGRARPARAPGRPGRQGPRGPDSGPRRSWPGSRRRCWSSRRRSRFDFRDVPIVEAVRAINRQAGLALTLAPEDDPALGRPPADPPDRPSRCRSGRRSTRLCEAGPAPLRSRRPGSPMGRRDAVVPALSTGTRPPPEPVSDSGPFRVHLASVHYQSEIQLSRPRPDRARGRIGRPSSDGPTRRGRSRPASSTSSCRSPPSPGSRSPRTGRSRLDSRRSTTAGKSLLIPADPASFQHSVGLLRDEPLARGPIPG